MGFLVAVRAQNQQGLDELRVRADEAYEQGMLLDALSDYERLVSLFPEEGCLHGRLAGCALLEPGRLTFARRHLRIAVNLGCIDVDVEFFRARLAQLEYDFERARDLYAAYLEAVGKRGRFKEEAEQALSMCSSVIWDPREAIGLEVLDCFPADPDGAFRFYRPQTPGIRLVNTPKALRTKADSKNEPGRIAFHNGDTLIVYASLGKSGKTGWDLYQISLSDGQYGKAQRLSDSVNSPYDERGAYLSKEGILYFSSNRPGGLGGQDIYAVKWGQQGPIGRPERLPFPINSVNDDEFFIPESDGGAWMSSNRAAREGQIHAYWVALSEAPFDAGSVSWLADEVASEEITLRVYSNGKEVSVRELDGESAEFQMLKAREGAMGVRVVLENSAGEIISESFGLPESSWELRKQGRGWSMVERSDVDWAILADLRGREGSQIAEVERAFRDEESIANSADIRGWGDWVSARLEFAARDQTVAFEDEATTASGQVNLESVVEASDVVERIPVVGDGTGKTVLEEEDQVTSSRDKLPLDDHVVAAEIEESDAKDLNRSSGRELGLEVQDLTLSKNTVANGSSAETEKVEPVNISDPRTVANVLIEGDAPTSEELRIMQEQEIEALTEVWNEKAERLLERELGFLDAPSMLEAGILSELAAGLSEWLPNGELMAPELRDGAAVEEIQEMIEAWSYAVQSATKASLAAVAGNAALAYRRERLAMREIGSMGVTSLSEAIEGISEWQSILGQRDGAFVRGVTDVAVSSAGVSDAAVSSTGVPDANGSEKGVNDDHAQIESWLAKWDAGLEAAERGWSRKQSAGWRGDWLKRQRRHLEVVRQQWEALLQETLAEPLADGSDGAIDEKDAAMLQAAEGKADLTVIADSSRGNDQVAEDAVSEGTPVDIEFLVVPFGRNSSETLVQFVLGGPMANSGEGVFDLSDRGVQDLDALMQAWQGAILDSRKVERAWEQMVNRNGGQGIPLVARVEDFESLNSRVARELLDLKQVMLELLSESVVALRPNEPFSSEYEGQDTVWDGGTDSVVREKMAVKMEDWKNAQLDTDSLGEAAKESLGVAKFEAQRRWHEALIRESRIRSAYRESFLAFEDEAVRLKKERLEAERLESERLESERLESERLESERLESERLESERLESERLESERRESERLESDRITTEIDVDEGFGAGAEHRANDVDDAVVFSSSRGDEEVFGFSREALSDGIGERLPSDWTLERGMGVLDSLLLRFRSSDGSAPIGWSEQELQLIESWGEWRDARGLSEPVGANAKRKEALDKDRFFARRNLQRALENVDMVLLEQRLETSSMLVFRASQESNLKNSTALEEEVEIGTESGRDPFGSSDTFEEAGKENLKSGVDLIDPIGQAVSSKYGITLPEAEVLGSGGSRNGGIRLRPIQREVLEKAILGSLAAQESLSSVSAKDKFEKSNARPKAVGVEYKVQVGAFRKALPVELFSVFDPMWAQRMPSGITRYLAGSFDAYDSAVGARDAIRDMGYSDAFVVRFISGERVRSARPNAEDLAIERSGAISLVSERIDSSARRSSSADRAPAQNALAVSSPNPDAPQAPEDIPTWDDVQGRVYSVQVGAFRGVPDAQSLEVLGTLTREESGSDGWLRLFSGRFKSEQEANDHRNDLRSLGRDDAFVVVYINGRRIPLNQASTTAIGAISNVPEGTVAGGNLDRNVVGSFAGERWCVELGRFDSTIPVRLANAILDAPLDWEIRSDRAGSQTVYLTRSLKSRVKATDWMEEAKRRGFDNAKLSKRDD